METLVLSASQQKNTLRRKRNKKKETIKNVLGTPYAYYWPLVKNTDETNLRDVLAKNLPRLRENKVAIPYRDIKNIPKDQRKSYRTKFNSVVTPIDVNVKSCLLYGVNEVTKLLENSNASCVILAADIEPRMMVKHIVDLAVLKSTPILVVPQLRDILKDNTGIPSIVVAIKKQFPESSCLNLVNECVEGIYVKYPPPENHIHKECAVKLNSEHIESCEKEINNSETKDTKMQSIDLSVVKKENNEKNIVSSDTPTKTKYNETGVVLSSITIKTEDVYLYRKSKSERVFVPESSSKRKESVANNADFLSFTSSGAEKVSTMTLNKISSNSQQLSKKDKKRKSKYKSLIVKRIRSNEHRSKKLITMLKQKQMPRKKS